MTKDEAIEKVKKLLALSRSPNEHEAALAATKAKQILDQYNLSGINFDEESKRPNFIKEFLVPIDNLEQWNNEISKVVMEVYNCSIFLIYEDDRPNFIVFGEEANGKIAAYVLDYMIKSVNRMAEECWERQQSGEWIDITELILNHQFSMKGLIDKELFLGSYKIGAAIRICEKLMMRLKSKEISKEKALIIVMKGAVIEHVEMKYGHPKEAVFKKDIKKTDDYAASLGYSEGNKINPNLALEAK
jgi:hypothetical protein